MYLAFTNYCRRKSSEYTLSNARDLPMPVSSSLQYKFGGNIKLYPSIQQHSKDWRERDGNPGKCTGLGEKSLLVCRPRKIIKGLTALKIQNKNQDCEFKALLLIVSNHSTLSWTLTIINTAFNFFFLSQEIHSASQPSIFTSMQLTTRCELCGST